MDVRTSPQLLKIDDNSKIEINNTPFSIGRSLNNNYVISSKLVSRKHCVFTRKELGWSITDCSTNGTRLNDELLRYTEANLKEGDVITLTSEPFIYRFLPNIIEIVDITDEQMCYIAERVETQELQKKHTIESQNPTTKKLKSTDETTTSENKDAKADQVPMDEIKNSEGASANNSHMNVIEDELTCSICSELFIKAVTLNCSHSFCKQCIEMWKKNKKICPICRAPITNINATLVLDNFISKTLEKATDEVKEHRKIIMAEREASEQKVKPAAQKNDNTDRVLRSTTATEVIELSDNDSLSDDSLMYFEEDSDLSVSEDNYDYLNDDWYNPSGHRGSRRPYYGGYGACYTCGQPGHWANSCPVRHAT
ncbi:unnamed protein product [Brassicogethes aeneus]|uniref:E3 ubiquitin-protein ligase CHFR n=1 Tax=Brassicogethes aeneus TaxID=1431903 RepID=A0A9P0AVY2_BRAAE|nr:unnamed protein product [Brassicogethes aeneus]